MTTFSFPFRRTVHSGKTRLPRSRMTPHDRILSKEPIHVVMLNDIGFQYGAGTAHRRQAASFLLNGWEVSAVAWQPGNEAERPMGSAE